MPNIRELCTPAASLSGRPDRQAAHFRRGDDDISLRCSSHCLAGIFDYSADSETAEGQTALADDDNDGKLRVRSLCGILYPLGSLLLW